MRVAVPRDLALAVRARRRELGWSQQQLADRCGTSRKWLSQFEQGKPSVELGLTLQVLEVLELQLSVDPVNARPAVVRREHNEPGRRVDLDDHLARTSAELER